MAVLRIVGEVRPVVAGQIAAEVVLFDREAAVGGLKVAGSSLPAKPPRIATPVINWNVAARPPVPVGRAASRSGLYVPAATQTSVMAPPESRAAVRAS